VNLYQISEQFFGRSDVVTGEVQLVDQAVLPRNARFAIGDVLLCFVEPIGCGGKLIFRVG
jgi:hypothetical protein